MLNRKKFLSYSLPAILACALLSTTAFTSLAYSSNPAPQAQATPYKTKTTTTSASDIANAKAKGLVWVNTESKVYHTGGKYYGNTKHGKFMTEADAQKVGYKASKR